MEDLQLLKSLIDRFEGKDVESEEQLAEQKQNEKIEYYLDVMQKKEIFSVVFNRMKEDGTLICVGEYVQIIMLPDESRNDLTKVVRLNHPHNVTVSEVDASEKIVYVKQVSPAHRYIEDNRAKVMTVLKELLSDVRKYVVATYQEDIEKEKAIAFEKYCKELNMETDSAKIDSALAGAEESVITRVIEQQTGLAYAKHMNKEILTEIEEKFLRLVVPAKLYSQYELTNTPIAAVDILGLRINGTIRPTRWCERYTENDLFRSEVAILIGRKFPVVILGYNERRDSFVCSKRAVQLSAWHNIEKYFSVGDLINVRCVEIIRGNRYIGRITGVSGKDASEFTRLNVLCYFPDSANAKKKKVVIKPGGVYVAKIQRIVAKDHVMTASTFDWCRIESNASGAIQ